MIQPLGKNPYVWMKSIWQDYAQFLGGLSVDQDARSSGFVHDQEQEQDQQPVIEIPDDNFTEMEITDSYTPSTESVIPDFIPPTRQQVLSMFNERSQKDHIVDQMLDMENSTAGNENNIIKLKSEMAGADLSVLREWQDSGMKIALVGDEDEAVRSNFDNKSMETNDIKPIDIVNSQVALHNSLQTNDNTNPFERISQLNKVLSTTTDNTIKAFDPRDYEKNSLMSTNLINTNQQSGNDFSVNQIAELNGNKKPEEIRQFTDQVHSLNGDRLSALQNQGYENIRQNSPGQEVSELYANKDNVPVDVLKNPILIPNKSNFVSPGTEGKETNTSIEENQNHNKWDRRDMEVKHSQEGNKAIGADSNAASLMVPIRETELDRGNIVPELSNIYRMSFNQVNHRMI
jgi:hypothetical protein